MFAYRDFKQIITPISSLDKYIVPKVEDLFSVLAGGKLFSNSFKPTSNFL